MIFNSTVVKDLSGARVLANAMPIGGISNIAKNSAMERSHGICMLWSGCQDDRRPPVRNVFCLKSNQPRDENVVVFVRSLTLARKFLEYS